jgi:hypothetical protein
MEKGAEQADTTRRPATADRKKAPKQAQPNPSGRPWQQTKAALRFAPLPNLGFKIIFIMIIIILI